ncbi:hypothetical protein IQ273_03110 [Nodosilinea sp. LEGE 07298]|uniref:hypothetical protein n=1 Tax=Nodosilinea sp. LEGE 07298 TaxID=2777970 RepID=UPI0018819A6D|nr:hypothetical protein [Nodosilinea sp. LEGE 07298]MBE9108408.1 hypothetical protein [Nodosilinea sp. LEGE 07298]
MLQPCQTGPEGHRVAAEIQRIQSALHQVGFRTRKQPKQPIWAITATDAQSYRLSFQPVPISGWVLHPIDESPVRQQITEIVQSVLAPERLSWRQVLASDAELHPDCRPWAIVMIRDAVQRSVITRFRNRQDADDHLRAMRRHIPQGVFEVMFDLSEEPVQLKMSR